MNQTVRYVIMTLLIIALAIWSITVYRSCQEIKDPIEQPEDISTVDTSDLEDLYVNEKDTTVDEFADTEPPVIIEEEEEPEDKTYNTKPENPTFNGGQFLVIAGAFISESNAKKAVNKLSKQGYQAEIRVFIGSEYHSVVVGAFDDMDEAFDIAIKLADAGYKDVYVHKKRPRKKR